MTSNYNEIWLDCFETEDFSNDQIYTNNSGFRIEKYREGRSFSECIKGTNVFNLNWKYYKFCKCFCFRKNKNVQNYFL